MPVTIIENDVTYTMDITYEEIERAVRMFLKERLRLREKCRKRYIKTGNPCGRPKKPVEVEDTPAIAKRPVGRPRKVSPEPTQTEL